MLRTLLGRYRLSMDKEHTVGHLEEVELEVIVVEADQQLCRRNAQQISR